jgi:AcrR family transcriptional regulator
MPVTKERGMSNRQQEIIAAAAQVFLEKGYHASAILDGIVAPSAS